MRRRARTQSRRSSTDCPSVGPSHGARRPDRRENGAAHDAQVGGASSRWRGEYLNPAPSSGAFKSALRGVHDRHCLMPRLAPRNPGARRRCLRLHPREWVGSLPSQLRPESMNREHASWETPSWNGGEAQETAWHASGGALRQRRTNKPRPWKASSRHRVAPALYHEQHVEGSHHPNRSLSLHDQCRRLHFGDPS